METEIPPGVSGGSAMIRNSSVDPGRTSHGSRCGIVVPVDTAEKRLAETRRVLEKLKTNTATREEKDRLNILLAQMERDPRSSDQDEGHDRSSHRGQEEGERDAIRHQG